MSGRNANGSESPEDPNAGNAPGYGKRSPRSRNVPPGLHLPSITSSLRSKDGIKEYLSLQSPVGVAQRSPFQQLNQPVLASPFQSPLANMQTRSPRQDSSSPILENGSPLDEEVRIRMTEREKKSLCHSVNYERLMNLRHHKAVTLKQKYKKKEQQTQATEAAAEDDEPMMSLCGSKASLLAALEGEE